SYEPSEPNSLPISALRGQGLEELKTVVEEAIVRSTGKQVLTLPVDLSSSQLRTQPEIFWQATVDHSSPYEPGHSLRSSGRPLLTIHLPTSQDTACLRSSGRPLLTIHLPMSQDTACLISSGRPLLTIHLPTSQDTACLRSSGRPLLTIHLPTSQDTACLRSSGRPLLTIPKSRLKTKGEACSIRAPRLWNGLPEQVRLADSVPLFKSPLL
uniref:Uncharacterized protein n=1 Tax=Hucho hucho TaxID=62062 RepID=A0A4W5KF35_9TELE